MPVKELQQFLIDITFFNNMHVKMQSNTNPKKFKSFVADADQQTTKLSPTTAPIVLEQFHHSTRRKNW